MSKVNIENNYLNNDIEKVKKNILITNQENNNQKNIEIELFKCELCKKEYTSKQNLIKHLKNKKMCENSQLLNKMLEQSKLKNSL